MTIATPTTNEIAGLVKTIEVYVCSANIEHKLYDFVGGRHDGKRAIRVRDLDAQENVEIIVYPTHAAADAEFAKLIADVKRGEA